MKKNLIQFTLLIFAMLITPALSAQFSLSGEFRPRTEISHGYGTLAADDQKASTFTSQRTRLNFQYNNEFVRTMVMIQDIRLWGNQPQLVENQEKAVSLHQGWAEVLFTKEFSLKAGRQELNYDDQRIFGNVGWTQQARSHDLALLKYEGNFKFHLGVAHNENNNRRNNLYDGPDAYKDLQFFWISDSWEKSSISLLFLNNGVPITIGGEQENRYSQTFGGHFRYQPEKMQFSANLYGQSGKDALEREINALNFMVEASFKANPTASATFGYEYLSGNDLSPEPGKNKAFNPLYGTNHKFNGFMDYFYVGGQHINSVGLQDAYFKWACSRFKNVQWNLHLHYFAASGEMNLSDAKSYLGTEIDFDLTYSINPFSKLTFGYSHLLAGESMSLIKSTGTHESTNNWAYLMLSVTPKFY